MVMSSVFVVHYFVIAIWMLLISRVDTLLQIASLNLFC